MKTCNSCQVIKSTDEFYSRQGKTKRVFAHICKSCHKAKVDTWRKANPQKYRKYVDKWKKANLEKVKQYSKDYWDRNPDKLKAKWATHQVNRKYGKRFQLNKEQRALLNDIYANCPPGYEVDHIIPLRGKTVSGLHAPWNLQYLTAEENRRKSNKV